MGHLRLTVLGLLALLTACAAGGVLPPALPEPPTAEAPVVVQPPPPPVVPPTDVVPEAPPPLPAPATPATRRRPQGNPLAVIATANATARVAPSRSGYGYGTSSSQRYPWWPGRLFEVYTAPAHPTTLRLPPGELLATGFAPTLDPALWSVGVIEQGEGAQAFHAVIIRPVAAGQEAATPLLLRSGKTLYCRVRSFEKTSMVEVTWEAPQTAVSPTRTPPDATAMATAHAVRIAPAPPGTARQHTAYTIAVQGAATPPWTPRGVWDDGTTTYMVFRDNLQFTNAPAVFVHTQRGGPPQLAQFTAAPHAPGGATTYGIRGLWPLIALQGDGMTVMIRRETTPPPQGTAPEGLDGTAPVVAAPRRDP